MSELVFLLEEESARVMLQGLLPRLVPAAMKWRCIVFEGKQDLEAQMVRRIRGYRVPSARFIVLRDKDSADCRDVKTSLIKRCQLANCNTALVRIACHEIESWYLADLAAVEKGLKISGLARNQKTKKYRDPDCLANPSEELEKLTKRKYQKVSGSRSIGPLLDIENRRSRSFAVFIDGVRRQIAALQSDTELA